MIDKSYWDKRPEIIIASSKGYNPLVMVPRLIKETYPDMRDFKFGFFIEKDLPARFAEGWRHLDTSDFPDWEDYNASLPLRYGLQEKGGHLTSGDNYVCIMHNDYRKKYEAYRDAESERLTAGSIASKENEADSDNMRAESTYTESRETHGSSSAPRRGRPRKS